MAETLLSAQGLSNFFNAYWFFIIPLVAAVILIIFFASRSRKTKLKVFSRAEIERSKFVERMKYNYPDNEHFLYRGKKLLGKIIAIKNESIEVKRNPENPKVEVINIVMKPTLFGWKIPVALGKTDCFIISYDHVIFDADNLIMKETVPLHNIFGIYYDETLEDRLVEFIKNDAVVRTSFEDAMSVFYVKAMEQATFDPEHAHATQVKQLDIEREKEKREQLVR